MISMQELVFVTGNKGKLKEAQEILKGVRVVGKDVKAHEIQSDDLALVAKDSCKKAYGLLKQPLFLEDSGLFIGALNGFPGVYSHFVNEKIGCNGILKLLEGVADRKAKFVCSLAYHDGSKIRIFTGECPGTIADVERGKGGFGFDPVFIPEGSTKTFAEDPAHKNAVSHRRRALDGFAAALKI